VVVEIARAAARGSQIDSKDSAIVSLVQE